MEGKVKRTVKGKVRKREGKTQRQINKTVEQIVEGKVGRRAKRNVK